MVIIVRYPGGTERRIESGGMPPKETPALIEARKIVQLAVREISQRANERRERRRKENEFLDRQGHGSRNLHCAGDRERA